MTDEENGDLQLETSAGRHRWVVGQVLVPVLVATIGGTVALLVAFSGLIPQILGSRTTEEIWFGYYADWTHDKKGVVNQETIVFKFNVEGPGMPEHVEANSSGNVEVGKGLNQERAWLYDGFRAGDYLVYAYASTGPGDYGIGGCFLRKQGGAFQGFWYGRDINHSEIIGGPYVLVRHKLTIEEAKSRYPHLDLDAKSIGVIPDPFRLGNTVLQQNSEEGMQDDL